MGYFSLVNTMLLMTPISMVSGKLHSNANAYLTEGRRTDYCKTSEGHSCLIKGDRRQIFEDQLRKFHLQPSVLFWSVIIIRSWFDITFYSIGFVAGLILTFYSSALEHIMCSGVDQLRGIFHSSILSFACRELSMEWSLLS